MFYVYAISSISRNYIYVGLTNNIEKRFAQHNKGENKSTKAIDHLFYFTQKYIKQEQKREQEKSILNQELEKNSLN